MNSKGFTLIELIAVTMILALIFLVSLPNILNMTKSQEIKKSQFDIDELCIAGEAYIHSYPEKFIQQVSTIGQTFTIEISTLIDYGNIDDNVSQDLQTKKLLYTVLDDHSLNCKLYD